MATGGAGKAFIWSVGSSQHRRLWFFGGLEFATRIMSQGFSCASGRSPIKLPSLAANRGNTADDAPRTIAFGIDSSKESFAAFSWAVANLIRQTDLVLLIHVYQRDYVFGSQYSKLANDNCRDMAKGIVTRYEERCKRHGLKCQSVVAEGNPTKVIADFTSANNCSLCIMGSKRRSYLMRFVLGSLVSGVLQLVTCPVMIIKKPKVRTNFSSHHPTLTRFFGL